MRFDASLVMQVSVALMVAFMCVPSVLAVPTGFNLVRKTESLKIPAQIYFGPFEATGRALVVEKNKGILIT